MRMTKAELMDGVECVSSKKVENNTIRYERENGEIVIRHFFTDILTFKPNGDLVIDCGGYRSMTTKDRLNRFQNRCYIIQDKSQWFIVPKNHPDPWRDKKCRETYFDGITIDKDGNILNPIPQLKVDKHKKAEKNFKKLVKAYLDKVRGMEKLPMPGNGDPWCCSMRGVNDGVSLGDMQDEYDHIKRHLTTKSVNGSFLFTALEYRGYGDPMFILQLGCTDSVCRALRKYFTDKLFKPLGYSADCPEKIESTGYAVR